MSRPRCLPFGNPFRRSSSKGSYLSPELLDLLNTFEETLAGRIKKLKPADKEDVLQLPWMRFAMETLCEIHTDVKTLITSLELPVINLVEKWLDVYLDDSVKYLDICVAFISEISQRLHGDFILRLILHYLGGTSKQLPSACSLLNEWKHHISNHHTASTNPAFNKCFSAMDVLAQKLDLPKIKNSAKVEVLTRAMYGAKMVTLLVCSTLAAAFSGSANKLMDLQLVETCLWAEAFADTYSFVNTEIRSLYSSGTITVLKELEGVDACVEKLYPMVQQGADAVDAEVLQGLTSELGESAEKFSQGFDLLEKEVYRFFKIVRTGHNAFLVTLGLDESEGSWS